MAKTENSSFPNCLRMFQFYILVFFLSSIESKEVLRYVQVIYRHGDRSPISLFPSDINKKDVWPYGLGQLTDIGIRQQFALGKWLRVRYKTLLQQTNNPQEIYVRSSDFDRTLMSAQSNLAGLYYEDKDPIIPGINWRPIPVHTVPKKIDPFMMPFQCKTYNKKLNEMHKTRRYKSNFDGFEETLELMRKVSLNKNMQFEDTYHIYDILFCEKTHNMSWPSWMNEEIYYNISKIYERSWKMLYEGDELSRLSGGRFLDEILTQMRNFVEKNNSKMEKMRMYSGHDTNIGSLLAAIGINNVTHPPYNACLMFELLYNPKDNSDSFQNWIIKIYYKTNESTNPLPEILIKGCKSQPCTLEDFIDYSKPRVLSVANFQQLCQPSNSGRISWLGSSQIYILFLFMYIIYDF